MTRYSITDEKTGEIFDYTNKRNAARKVTELTKAGHHHTASIWNENGVRIDGDSANALAVITRR